MPTLLTILACLFSFSVHANVDLSKLTREQREQLYKGEFVLTTTAVKDAPWPVVTVYRLIDHADALSFGAFFADFLEQPKYVPDLLKAKIHHENNPRDVQVQYEMHLPWPIPNAVYIHGHHLTWPTPGNLKVAWYLVESSVAQKVEGFSEFVSLDDKVLWHYQTFVHPKSSLASLFERSMQNDVLKSLEATLKAFLELREKNPKHLEAMIKVWQERFSNSTK